MPLKMRSFLLLTIQNSKPLWPSCFQNSVVVKNVCITDAHYELRLTLKLILNKKWSYSKQSTCYRIWFQEPCVGRYFAPDWMDFEVDLPNMSDRWSLK